MRKRLRTSLHHSLNSLWFMQIPPITSILQNIFQQGCDTWIGKRNCQGLPTRAGIDEAFE